MAKIKRETIIIPRGILSIPSGSFRMLTICKNGTIRIKIYSNNNRRI